MKGKDLKVVWALSLIRFAYFLDFMIMMPLGKYLMSSLNISTHEFGILVASYTFSAGFSGMFNTLFIDRFNRKKVLIFVFVNFAIATLLCGMAYDYHTFLAGRIYAGLFGGVLSSMIYTVLSDVIAYQERGRAMGYLMASSSIAFILGPPLSLFLTTHYNWSIPFILLGFLSLGLTIYCYFSIPLTPKPTIKEHESFFLPYKLAITIPGQRNAILLIIALAFGQYSIIPYVSPYIQLNLGSSAKQLALFLSLGGFFSVLSSIWIGKLSDRFGKHQVSKALIVLSIIGMALVTNLNSPNPFLIGFSVVLFFITITGRLVPSLTIVTSVSSPQHQASFLTIQNSIQQFSSSLASYTGSLIITKEVSGIQHFPMVGILGICFSVVAYILISKIQRTKTSHDHV